MKPSVPGPDVTLKIRIICLLAPSSTLNGSDKCLLAGFNIHLYSALAAYVSSKIRGD